MIQLQNYLEPGPILLFIGIHICATLLYTPYDDDMQLLWTIFVANLLLCCCISAAITLHRASGWYRAVVHALPLPITALMLTAAAPFDIRWTISYEKLPYIISVFEQPWNRLIVGIMLSLIYFCLVHHFGRPLNSGSLSPTKTLL